MRLWDARLLPRVRPFRTRLTRSSSVLLAVANFSEFAFPLIRGVVLARILPPTQFGLAVSITLTASTLEMISDLGIGQLATRSGSAETLPSLHALTIVRGLMLGLVIAASGPLLALMFEAPGTAWIYTVIGVASFIRSFSHLETRMRMREYRYTPEALTTLGSHAAWTVASIIAAIWLRDYRAMVVGLLVFAGSTTLITHWCSSMPYRLGWTRNIVADAVRFGRPLTVNGVALAVVQMGDRFLVGARLGLDQLAHYTALATAAFAPRSVVTKFAVSLFLPQFVNAADDEERRRLADAWVILLAALGGVFALFFMALGQALVAITFGRHYLPDQMSVSLIAGLASIRFMSNIPTAPSVASGRTSFVLLNTTLASSGIVLAAVLLIFYRELHAVLGALIVGEGLALVWVLDRLRRLIPMTTAVLWGAVLATWAVTLTVGVVLAALATSGLVPRYAVCGSGVLVEMLCAALLLRQSGSDLSSVLQMLLPRRTPSMRPAANTP